jgi:tetratricopeptide (TPR) repeat protein
MLADWSNLPLSTTSAAARDAYAEGQALALTLYPGAIEAFDRALVADPGLALAHAGKATVLMREGKAAEARECLGRAKSAAAGVSPREAGHIEFFDLAFAGRVDAAIAALYTQLASWPRDTLLIANATNPNGLIGGCGRVGQKRQIAELMNSLAPHYGDDYWFLSYHAIALAEDGQLAAARAKIERSVALSLKNAHVAHGFAHVCYESGAADAGRDFLSSWLAGYPRDGAFHGHISWHLALFEIGAGHWAEAQQLYRDAITLERHSSGPQQKMTDGAGFLWRSELAGYPRDNDAWRKLYEFGKSALARPGPGLADLHVLLTMIVMGDDTGLEARIRQMQELAHEGRYPSGSYLPALSRGFVAFERGDYAAAIAALAPLAGQNERIGGSRAQHDLIEFTLLKACINANRLNEARQLLAKRRPDATGIPVAGMAVLQ